MSFRGRGGRGMGNGRFPGGGDGGKDGGRGGREPDHSMPQRGPVSNHTSDASMASARIFIGNLPTSDSRLTKDVLEENFGKFGRILGISILKGFGFIQYAEEVSAENAIRNGQNIEILAHRMDVKPVKTSKDSQASSAGVGGGVPPVAPGGADGANYRDRSPLRRRESFDMARGPMGREPDMVMGRDGIMRGGMPLRDMMERDRHDFGNRPSDWNSRGGDRHPRDMESYPVDPYMDRGDMRPHDPFMPPGADHRGNYGAGLPPKQGGMPPAANEVEIVVTSRIGPMRQYAEQIESRIRALGLIVDVLFPHEDIPIRQVLGDLSSRGTLYGVVLTPVGEQHGSLTLNILFGQPEEHRNMPMEDALALLATSYRAYKQQQPLGGIGGGRGLMDQPPLQQQPAVETARSVGGLSRGLVTDPHPASIQVLINALQENRPLSVLEYDRVIRYLSERRDRQAAEEPRGLAGSTSQPTFNQNATTAHQDPHELQQRILSILSSSAGGVAGAGLGGPAPVPVPAPWNAADINAIQQQPRADDQSHNLQKSVESLIQTGANHMKHYQIQQQTGNRQQQEPHRPIPQQQQGNYYSMGKRF